MLREFAFYGMLVLAAVLLGKVWWREAHRPTLAGLHPWEEFPGSPEVWCVRCRREIRHPQSEVCVTCLRES